MGQLSHWFPEVEALIGVPQEPRYHREGDVWTHTMLVLDQAAALRSRAQQPFPFMLAALCHDLGKPAATEYVRGRIHAYDHESAGYPWRTPWCGASWGTRRQRPMCGIWCSCT